MKRKYIKPTTFVAEMKSSGIICASKVVDITSNEELIIGGEGDVPGRSLEAVFSEE